MASGLRPAGEPLSERAAAIAASQRSRPGRTLTARPARGAARCDGTTKSGGEADAAWTKHETGRGCRWLVAAPNVLVALADRARPCERGGAELGGGGVEGASCERGGGEDSSCQPRLGLTAFGLITSTELTGCAFILLGCNTM